MDDSEAVGIKAKPWQVILAMDTFKDVCLGYECRVEHKIEMWVGVVLANVHIQSC